MDDVSNFLHGFVVGSIGSDVRDNDEGQFVAGSESLDGWCCEDGIGFGPSIRWSINGCPMFLSRHNMARMADCELMQRTS